MNSTRLILNSAVSRTAVSGATRRIAYPRNATRIGLSSNRPQLPRHTASLFICLRDLSTQTSSTPGAAGAPPPGFNIEEAKRPLPKALAENKSDGSKPGKPEDPAKEITAKDLVKEEKKKETVWQKVKHGVQHFWDGTKLLGVEIKISYKLALKMAAGYELSRRERRQLERTVKDLGRLVPFSVFIIVPAGELFLPIALKFFPNLLPSTYEDQKQKDAKSKKLRSTRKDVSEFLRTTMKEGGILPIGAKTRQSEEFAEFFKKIRTSNLKPSREELIKVCKIFKDDVTLDNLSRPQLVGMCRYMNLNTFGTDSLLRYNIRHRLRQLKRDDRAISFEGIDSLSIPELQSACMSRGIRTHGVSPARLREDLSTWLELRLKHGLPSTLMVLSNAFMYAQGKETELDSHYDALRAVLSSIPEELYHEIELEVHAAEGAATNKQRLEVFKEQQEMIEEENEQRAETGHKEPTDEKDIDEKMGIAVAEEKVPGNLEIREAVKDADDYKKSV